MTVRGGRNTVPTGAIPRRVAYREHRFADKKLDERVPSAPSKAEKMARKAPTNDDLSGRLAKLEKKHVTREKVEEIAAGAALDVLKFHEKEVKKATEAVGELSRALEEKEFARRVAGSLGFRVCRRKLDELTEDVDREELERVAEAKAEEALSSRLESPEFAEKLREIARGTEDIGAKVEEVSKRLAERLDRIQQEALPELVEKLLGEKLEEKFGAVTADAVAAKLDGQAFQRQVLEVARSSIPEVVNTPEFKAMLDEKFKVMITYLVQDLIPKQIKRLMGG